MAGIKTAITLIKTTFNDSMESRKITNYALKFNLHLQFLEEITRVRTYIYGFSLLRYKCPKLYNCQILIIDFR